jgi:hypothetical protein
MLSSKPLFSNLTFVYFLGMVSLHLHMLPQYHQSHLHLASLLPVIFVTCLIFFLRITKFLNLIIISAVMLLLIQFPMFLKCIPYIT